MKLRAASATLLNRRKKKRVNKMIKIMLDAGHYGKYNQSSAFSAYFESDMSWKLSGFLASELEKYGIEVSFTRDDKEKDLEVFYRGAMAKGCDMFISLHSNAVGSSVNDEIDHPVVFRLYRDNEGEKLAQKLSDKIAELMGTVQRGKTATKIQKNGTEYYGVLRGADSVKCPHAFIIEHSFHTATKPSIWLYDENNLRTLAVNEARIIAEFFGIQGENNMTDEERKRFSELENKVNELEKSKERVYRYYSELPDYARDIITSLHKNGVFKGNGQGDMNLPESLMRMLVILASNGILKP